MQPTSALHWFAKCGFGAGLLLLVCGVATAWFGNGLQLPSTTTRDGTLITLNRYVRQPIPDVVLVGSSLTFRLKEEYFTAPWLRNLALAGGSPVTGLEIVANQPRLPKVILVEANVLSRSTDVALVAKYSRADNPRPLFFRPIRTAVAAYENLLHAPLNHAQAFSSLHQLLRGPPSDFDNHVYTDRALNQWNAEDPTAAVQTSVLRIEQLIPAIERRGARVLLFELPCSTQLEGSRSAEITHKIIHAAFPGPSQWLRVDYPRDELRWADGVHLDERSAVIVAESIDKALSSLPRLP
jgi:hypothetical protein